MEEIGGPRNLQWESAKDRAVTWGDLKHIESLKLSFLKKAVYDVFPTRVTLLAWELTTSDRHRTCGENSQPQIYSHRMRVRSKKLHVET